jgi:hypothetical protein
MARWTPWAIWGYQRQAPYGAPRPTTTTRGSLHRSRRRGRTNVRTYSRSRAPTDPCRGCHDVPCRPQDGHPVGKGREADVNPHARGAPALPGDRGSCSARGHSAAAFRVTSCLQSRARRTALARVLLPELQAELVRRIGGRSQRARAVHASDLDGVGLDAGVGGTRRAGTSPEAEPAKNILWGDRDAAPERWRALQGLGGARLVGGREPWCQPRVFTGSAQLKPGRCRGSPNVSTTIPGPSAVGRARITACHRSAGDAALCGRHGHRAPRPVRYEPVIGFPALPQLPTRKRCQTKRHKSW